MNIIQHLSQGIHLYLLLRLKKHLFHYNPVIFLLEMSLHNHPEHSFSQIILNITICLYLPQAKSLTHTLSACYPTAYTVPPATTQCRQVTSLKIQHPTDQTREQSCPQPYLLRYRLLPPSARFRFAPSRCMLSPSTSIKKYNIRLISRMSTYKKRTNRFMQA